EKLPLRSHAVEPDRNALEERAIALFLPVKVLLRRLPRRDVDGHAPETVAAGGTARDAADAVPNPHGVSVLRQDPVFHMAWTAIPENGVDRDLEARPVVGADHAPGELTDRKSTR